MSRLLAAAIFVSLILPVGCGYHPAGSPAHLPNTVHTLAVPVFRNETQSYHTEVAFTQAVVRELSNRTGYETIVNAALDAAQVMRRPL